ncbi:hypothetical protein FE393_18905 [Xenorhabdus sp. psl]|nr:hypothetical protein [Xenorhabdus sp. psl]
MRAKFFRFQFVMEVLYKLLNFGIQNYRENGKQKFRKSKNRDFQFNKFQNQIPYQKSKITPPKMKIPQNYIFKKIIKKRAVFYRYIYY